MTVIEEIAAKCWRNFAEPTADDIAGALRDLLDRCVAEVEADITHWEGAKQLSEKLHHPVSVKRAKARIEELTMLKSRLARLGESGERDAK